MKRSLSIILTVAVFASVIAGAVAFSTLKLLGSRSAASKEVVSRSSKPSPTIVGTDHPVAVNPPVQLAARPKSNAPNPRATPVPQSSVLVENASGHPSAAPSNKASRQKAESLSDNTSRDETESPAEIVREKAEQARERAESLRARVEELYQAHRISETAYKQGQAEYQHELAKYEGLIARLRDGDNGTGTSNE
jgi:hypothetical protein